MLLMSSVCTSQSRELLLISSPAEHSNLPKVPVVTVVVTDDVRVLVAEEVADEVTDEVALVDTDDVTVDVAVVVAEVDTDDVAVDETEVEAVVVTEVVAVTISHPRPTALKPPLVKLLRVASFRSRTPFIVSAAMEHCVGTRIMLPN